MLWKPHGYWCPGPKSNRHALFREATDFKSGVSTSFTTGAESVLCLENGLRPTQPSCKFSMASAYKAITVKYAADQTMVRHLSWSRR